MKRLIMTMLCLLTVATPVKAQSPSDVDYVNAARKSIELGEYQQAIQYLNEAIKINPYDSISYFNLGFAYEKLKLYQNAFINYNYSIQLNSLVSGPYCARGNSYFYFQQYENARADYFKCSELALKYGENRQYEHAQKSIKDAQYAIDLTRPKPQPAVTKPQKKAPVVDAKTRNQIVNRACSLAKKGLTGGEIFNEIHYLVQINANPEYENVYISSYGSSIASQINSIFNEYKNNTNAIDKEREAINIFKLAQKKCKF